MDHNTKNIGDLVKAFLRSRGLDERMEELDLADKWEELVGPMIAKHTVNIKLKNKVLELKLNSAALRHSLTFSKSDLIQRLNEALGKELIQEVVLK
jgi:predicted nucleic acid-binding Zn ribbon protein